MSTYRELLIGCGHRRDKLLGPPGVPLQWHGLVTLDINEKCKPDILCDLDQVPWRPIDWFNRSNQPQNIDEIFLPLPNGEFCFKHNMFDEVHAYEVLEHIGSQGDAKKFFSDFQQIWNILKPGGYLFGTVPSRYSPWLWGDPSHRRAILPESLVFLSQQEYKNQCDGDRKTPMSDFRDIYKGDFNVIAFPDNHTNMAFCLEAVKPPR